MSLLRLCLPLLGLSLLCGCATKGPPPGSVPSERQLAAWLRSAKTPDLFWVRMGVDDSNEIIYANANRVSDGKFAELPIVKSGPTPFPTTELPAPNGGDQRILFDTSSRHTWTDFGNGLGIKATPLSIRSIQVQPRHVADPRTSYRSIASVLKLGGSRVESAVVHVRPVFESLGPVDRGLRFKKWRPNLVIGNEILSHFRMAHFDFPRRRIVLASSLDYTIEPDSGAVILPLRVYRGALTVPANIDGGAQRGLIIDTGGDFALALPEPKGPSASLQLGTLRFDQLPVTPTRVANLGMPDVPRLGMHVLRHYRMTLEHRPAVEGGDANWRLILEEPYVPDPSQRQAIIDPLGLFNKREVQGGGPSGP